MRSDRDKWDSKFGKSDEPTLPAGEPELVALVAHLPTSGLALELACGTGKNALYLATLGLDVVAIDGSINGLRRCERGAHQHELSVQPVLMDLDFAALPERAFDLVSVIRYLNRDLFKPITAALSPGGLLFYKTFNRRHLASSPSFNEAFLLEDGELETAFGNLNILAADERGESSWILARNSQG